MQYKSHKDRTVPNISVKSRQQRTCRLSIYLKARPKYSLARSRRSFWFKEADTCVEARDEGSASGYKG